MSASMEPVTHPSPLIPGAELHLYVVEFVGHGVKVGVSGKPDQRIAQHRRDAAAYGREVGRTFISDPHQEKQARANERSLKQLGGPDHRREYLALGFPEVANVAASLPAPRADKAAVEQKREATTEFFKALVAGGLR